MKFTKAQFKKSKRLQRYETQLRGFLFDQDQQEVAVLQTNFKYKASNETLRYITKHSDHLFMEAGDVIRLHGLHAIVTYTISGNRISGVILGGTSGDPEGGTVGLVAMDDTYSFDIEVFHNGGNWEFNTTEILVNDGSERKLERPKRSDNFSDVIETEEI